MNEREIDDEESESEEFEGDAGGQETEETQGLDERFVADQGICNRDISDDVGEQGEQGEQLQSTTVTSCAERRTVCVPIWNGSFALTELPAEFERLSQPAIGTLCKPSSPTGTLRSSCSRMFARASLQPAADEPSDGPEGLERVILVDEPDVEHLSPTNWIQTSQTAHIEGDSIAQPGPHWEPQLLHNSQRIDSAATQGCKEGEACATRPQAMLRRPTGVDGPALDRLHDDPLAHHNPCRPPDERHQTVVPLSSLAVVWSFPRVSLLDISDSGSANYTRLATDGTADGLGQEQRLAQTSDANIDPEE